PPNPGEAQATSPPEAIAPRSFSPRQNERAVLTPKCSRTSKAPKPDSAWLDTAATGNKPPPAVMLRTGPEVTATAICVVKRKGKQRLQITLPPKYRNRKPGGSTEA